SVVQELHGASQPPEASRLLNASVDLLAGRRFEALAFVGDDGERVPVFGLLDERPTLTDVDRDNLRAGLPLIVSSPQGPASTRTFMVRRLDRGDEAGGTLVGEVSSEFLWGALASNLPTPTTVVVVQDDSGRVLFRSTQADLVSQSDPINEVAPVVRPTRSDSLQPLRPFVSSSTPILLDEVFAAPTWTLVLSESKDEVLGPLARFTRLFGWAILCAGIAVLLLSGTQIQRSLVPLV